MKITTTVLALAAIFAAGCTNSGEPIEITVKQEGNSDYRIRIAVEGKEDVIVDDPYESKIQELSRGFAAERANFIENRESMTSEQRKAYGKLRSEVAAQIRELDKLRRSHVRAQMEAYDGIGFTLEANDSGNAAEGVNGYLESLEN